MSSTLVPVPSVSHRCGRARLLMVVVAAVALVVGFFAVAVESALSPAVAAEVSFSQCNGRGAGVDGAPLSVTCSVSIVNTIDATGASSSVVYVRNCTLNACTGDTVSSSDVITAVDQCNGSDNVGGSATVCTVDIVNNISIDAPAAPTPLTVNQCVGSGGGGGTNMTACVPSSQPSPTVTQCNGSGNGGGGLMNCTASGTQSASFPVTVNQCNGSENGGGSSVTCTTTITNNVVDTTEESTVPGGSTVPGTGTTPTGDGTTPTSDGTTPTSDGTTPTGDGSGASGAGSGQGTTPGGSTTGVRVATPVIGPPTFTG